jgi:hypothetical protein
MTDIQNKKEILAKKPTKISLFREDMDQVIFNNMKRLVDPSSNGAKRAIQEKMKEMDRKISPLPSISQRY